MDDKAALRGIGTGVWVPMEPTRSMLSAFYGEMTTAIEDGGEAAFNCVRDGYKAMLSAASAEQWGGSGESRNKAVSASDDFHAEAATLSHTSSSAGLPKILETASPPNAAPIQAKGLWTNPASPAAHAAEPVAFGYVLRFNNGAYEFHEKYDTARRYSMIASMTPVYTESPSPAYEAGPREAARTLNRCERVLIEWTRKYGEWSEQDPIVMQNKLPPADHVRTLEAIDGALRLLPSEPAAIPTETGEAK